MRLSKIRNKALAHAFLYMNLIEEWGTGIPKLIQEMQERNLREPEFIDMESAFRVNLYRPAMGGQLKDKFVIEPVESQSEPVEPDNATLKPEDATLKPENATLKPENATLKPNVPNSQERLQKSPVSISDAERKVLQILAISPLLTQTELAQKSGISIFTIKRMLPELRKKGLIKRTGSRRDGKWEVLLGDLC
ncbi:MAG: MarR family transcriptional regulator [Proteobacteria bacterium]|nr:MarR family transcriptional regulator [Pseudomonadota bacterium]